MLFWPYGSFSFWGANWGVCWGGSRRRGNCGSYVTWKKEGVSTLTVNICEKEPFCSRLKMAFGYGHSYKYLEESLATCSFRLTMAVCSSLGSWLSQLKTFGLECQMCISSWEQASNPIQKQLLFPSQLCHWEYLAVKVDIVAGMVYNWVRPQLSFLISLHRTSCLHEH